MFTARARATALWALWALAGSPGDDARLQLGHAFAARWAADLRNRVAFRALELQLPPEGPK